MDWYNLEKSKRVKAFRCGEFDDCIERIEASQSIPLRKREKYARREDAILHALELEKQFEMKHTKPGLYGKFASHKYQTVSRKMVVPHEQNNISKSLYIHKRGSGKKIDCDEDIPEAIFPVGELHDFGRRITPSKRKLSASVTWETYDTPENHVDVLSHAGHMMDDAVMPVHTGSGKSSMLINRKRSEGSMVEDALFRKLDRHQPLVQVSQSSANLPISCSFQSDFDTGVISREDEENHLGTACRAKRSTCIFLPANSNVSSDHSGYCAEEFGTTDTQFKMNNQLHHPASLAEEPNSSGLIETTESDSSEKVIWEDELEEMGNLLTELKDCDPCDFQIQKCGNLDKDELPLSSCISQSLSHEQAADVSAEMGVYRWHVKGKRNRRNFAKRPLHRTSQNHFKDNDSTRGMARMEPSSQRTSGQGLYHNKEFTRTSDVGLAEVGTNLTGYASRKCHRMSHTTVDDSDSGSQLMSHSGWEDDGPCHSSQRVYWDESDDCFEPVYAGRAKPMLVDVDLKVQARYQGEHVPLVSLMSRLNGKAIIGHPVQVEILDDSTTPTWWTARRSDTHLSTSAFEADHSELSPCSGFANKKYSSHFSHQAQMAKKSMSYARRPMSGKSHKKSAKRVNSEYGISSTAAGRKRRCDDYTVKATLLREVDISGGLIDPEAVVPSVTCVPAKVVFSRILESVGRPSAAAAHRVRRPG